MNPYDVLGVPPDADAKAIKRAYRRRARETHPDAGGNSASFHEVVRANLVLADPARRAKFDRTGEIDEEAVDNSLARAISAIVGFFASFASAHAQGGNDPSTLNMVKEARTYFCKQLNEQENRRPPILRARDSLLDLESRLSGKGPQVELLKQALKAQAHSTAEPLAGIDREVAHNKQVLDLLSVCSFKEKAGAGSPRQTIVWSPRRRPPLRNGEPY